MKLVGSIIVISLLVAGEVVFAGDMGHEPKPSSPELGRIKALAGTWTGTMDMGQGEQSITVTYRPTASGSAVVETLHEGTPMEMVSVYHDVGDTLTMTHYCMLGNQPTMKLQSADAKSLALSLIPGDGISDPNEPHMHELTIQFLDLDTIEHHWVFYEQGKPQEKHPVTLKRVK